MWPVGKIQCGCASRCRALMVAKHMPLKFVRCRRLGGEIEVERRAPIPGNRFRFRDRACRAGEAKLRGRARE
eukprot:1677217-Pyramimonas_sp.AAC.1